MTDFGENRLRFYNCKEIAVGSNARGRPYGSLIFIIDFINKSMFPRNHDVGLGIF